jgi:excisionase family DNA binding protein
LTIDELALELKVSVKSIRRAYRKGEIPVDRFCRFVRFDLERVKEAMQANGHGRLLSPHKNKGQRSATGGASRRRAQRTRPRLGKTGASIAQKPRGKK